MTAFDRCCFATPRRLCVGVAPAGARIIELAARTTRSGVSRFTAFARPKAVSVAREITTDPFGAACASALNGRQVTASMQIIAWTFVIVVY